MKELFTAVVIMFFPNNYDVSWEFFRRFETKQECVETVGRFVDRYRHPEIQMFLRKRELLRLLGQCYQRGNPLPVYETDHIVEYAE